MGAASKGRPAARLPSLAGRPPPPKDERGKPRERLRGCFYFNQPRLRKYSMGPTALAAISVSANG